MGEVRLEVRLSSQSEWIKILDPRDWTIFVPSEEAIAGDIKRLPGRICERFHELAAECKETGVYGKGGPLAAECVCGP